VAENQLPVMAELFHPNVVLAVDEAEIHVVLALMDM